MGPGSLGIQVQPGPGNVGVVCFSFNPTASGEKGVIERAGFKSLLEGVRHSEQGLASIPSSIRHFQIEAFKERPVQATIVAGHEPRAAEFPLRH